jgi:hypothetical protein
MTTVCRAQKVRQPDDGIIPTSATRANQHLILLFPQGPHTTPIGKATQPNLWLGRRRETTLNGGFERVLDGKDPYIPINNDI